MESFREALPQISGIQIPRLLGTETPKRLYLHGFASQSYAAAVNSVTPVTHGQVGLSQLITAETKVAPVKTVSIPRLELCAAVLLARLLRYVMDVYSEVSFPSAYA